MSVEMSKECLEMSKEYRCVTCRKMTKDPITIMHAQMHRYVCSRQCMYDFYYVLTPFKNDEGGQ